MRANSVWSPATARRRRSISSIPTVASCSSQGRAGFVGEALLQELVSPDQDLTVADQRGPMAGVQPRREPVEEIAAGPRPRSRSPDPPAKGHARAQGQSSPALCQAPLSSRSIARRTVRVPASR